MTLPNNLMALFMGNLSTMRDGIGTYLICLSGTSPSPQARSRNCLPRLIQTSPYGTANGESLNPTRYGRFVIGSYGLVIHSLAPGLLFGGCSVRCTTPAQGVHPTCHVCLVAPKTPNHLFFECKRTRHRWARIHAVTRGSRFDFSNCFTLLEIASTAIARQWQCPTLFLIFVETIHLIWTESNSVVFKRDRSEALNALIWRWVGDRLDALLYKLENIKMCQTANEDRRRISYFEPSVTLTISDLLY